MPSKDPPEETYRYGVGRMKEDETFSLEGDENFDFDAPTGASITEERRAEIALTILKKLEDLERRLDDLPTGRLGHNEPPNDIGIPPYSEDDKTDIKIVIETVRGQVSENPPETGELIKAQQKFRHHATRILRWLAGKADLAVTEAVKAAAKGTVWGGIITLMFDIADEIAALLRLFGIGM